MFDDAEIERLAACLARLVPNLRRDEVALTGGVVIELGLAEAGHPGSRRSIADLDIVASSLDVVLPAVTESFLVFHYHVARPGVPKFMVQLVDPATRIRVDIFPDLAGSLARAKLAQIGGQAIKRLALDDILEHKLLMISKASPASTIDPKHVDDAYALGKLLQRSVPNVDARALAKDVYGGETDRFCPRCELSGSARFPLAPKDQILDLLGWHN